MASLDNNQELFVKNNITHGIDTLCLKRSHVMEDSVDLEKSVLNIFVFLPFFFFSAVKLTHVRECSERII